MFCRGRVYVFPNAAASATIVPPTRVEAGIWLQPNFKLSEEEPRAVLTHCYGHVLNLAVGDVMKLSKVCSDALDVAFEASKLIRFSL